MLHMQQFVLCFSIDASLKVIQMVFHSVVKWKNTINHNLKHARNSVRCVSITCRTVHSDINIFKKTFVLVFLMNVLYNYLDSVLL